MVRVFLLLLAGITATWLIADTIKQKGPGYVLVYYNQYSVETSVWIAVLLLFALVFLFYLLIRFFHYLLQAGLLVSHQRRKYRQRQQQRSVHAVMEQDWQQAVDLADKGQTVDDWLLAAHAALAAAAWQDAESYLRKARLADSAPEPVLSILRYDLLLGREKFAEAETLLEKLLRQHKKHSGILRRAVDYYSTRHEVSALQALLPQLTRKMPPLLHQLQNRLLLQAADCLFADAENRKSIDELNYYWKTLAKSPARDVLLPLYCRKLIQLGSPIQAEKLLRSRLHKSFDENCLVPYAMLETADKAGQLAFLESLQENHRNNAQLHLAIGIMHLKQLQLSPALQAIEHSIRLRPEPEAYQALAQYYDKRNDYQHARQSMQQALALAVTHR